MEDNLIRILDGVIDTYKDLINNNEFEKIYHSIYNEGYGSLVIGAFTDLLYENGIDPLKHMNFIPENFSRLSEIKELTIPKNIKRIDAGAFGPDLERLRIESDAFIMHKQSIESCPNLKEVICNEDVWEIHFANNRYLSDLNNIKWTPIDRN